MSELLENPIVRHWVIILSITFGIISIWPISVKIRRWWLAPFYNAKRLERELVKRVGIDRSQLQKIRQLLGTRDPILISQYIVDPKAKPKLPSH